MITGTLDECRHAAEIMIRKHAEHGGYDVSGATIEPQADGVTWVIWSGPKGKLKVEYRHTPSGTDNLVAPLNVVVTAEERAETYRNLEAAKALMAGASLEEAKMIREGRA